MTRPLREVVSEMLASPIAFHPVLARISGSVTAGLMLSQALYWAKVLERTNLEANGWFYKTQAEWTSETCLSRWEQDGARKLLRSLPFWSEDRRGVPAKSYFRVDLEKLVEAIAGNVEKPHSRLRKNLREETGKTSIQNAENQQSLIGTETTAQTLREISANELFEETLFETWWSGYPRKLNRFGCVRLWNELSVLDRAAAFEGLKTWKQSSQWQNPKFIPNPETFLKRRQWLDAPAEDANGSSNRHRTTSAAVARPADKRYPEPVQI